VTLTAPDGLAITTAHRTITVTWNAVPGVSTYRILRDGEVLGDTSSTTYTDADLDYATRYCYMVQAVDGARVGPQSDQVCKRTRPDYSGDWSGTTSQGAPIAFTVIEDRLTVLAVTLKVHGSSVFGACTVTRTFTVGGVSIIGRGFFYSSTLPTTEWKIDGNFDSANVASGTAQMEETIGLCEGQSGTITWTATRP